MKFKTIIICVLLALVVFAGVYYFFHKAEIVNYPSHGTDIIAFGDSLVEGVGSTNGNDFISVLSQKINQPIINLGHSGDTTKDGIERLSQLDKYNPKVVLLLFGGNDFLQHIPVAQMHQNLAILIQNIESHGAIVLLLGIRGGLLTDQFSSEFNNLRDTYHTALVSDVLDGLFGNTKYMSDEVHPNDAGYKIIAERIYPVLVKLIK